MVNKQYPYYDMVTDEQFNVIKSVHDEFVQKLDQKLNEMNNSWKFRTKQTKSKMGTKFVIGTEEDLNNNNPELKVMIKGNNLDSKNPKEENVVIRVVKNSMTRDYNNVEEVVSEL